MKATLDKILTESELKLAYERIHLVDASSKEIQFLTMKELHEIGLIFMRTEPFTLGGITSVFAIKILISRAVLQDLAIFS